MHSPGPLLQVEGDASMKSSHDDTLSSRTRGADAPAKRPLEGDSAAEVDARRSFVALYAPSVVGTEWTELVLPGGSSVVPAAVFNCPATEGPQEQWVQMALYGGAFVFGVLADVLEAKNAREWRPSIGRLAASSRLGACGDYYSRLCAMPLSLFSSPTATRLLRWCHVCPRKMTTQKRGRKQPMVPWQGMDCSEAWSRWRRMRCKFPHTSGP